EGVDARGMVFDPVFAREPLRPARMAADETDYPATTTALNLGPGARDYLEGIVTEISGGQVLDARTFSQRVCEWLAAHTRYYFSVFFTACWGVLEVFGH